MAALRREHAISVSSPFISLVDGATGPGGLGTQMRDKGLGCSPWDRGVIKTIWQKHKTWKHHTASDDKRSQCPWIYRTSDQPCSGEGEGVREVTG